MPIKNWEKYQRVFARQDSYRNIFIIRWETSHSNRCGIDGSMPHRFSSHEYFTKAPEFYRRGKRSRRAEREEIMLKIHRSTYIPGFGNTSSHFCIHHSLWKYFFQVISSTNSSSRCRKIWQRDVTSTNLVSTLFAVCSKFTHMRIKMLFLALSFIL